jgi:iron complex transport system substrate-binding protein
VPPPEPTATPLPKPERKPTPIPAPTPVPAVFPFTVIDSNGDEVTFDEPPGRIVAFDSAVVEILFAIGEGGRVVGTHDFVAYPPEAETIPRLGSAFSMNIESTVALQPDLVFIFFDAFKADLERAGLKVLYLQSLGGDFIKIAETVRLWGGITGKPGIAEEVATDFEDRVQTIRDVMESYESGPSVFQDDGALWTPGPDTLLGEVFEMLKLRNIAQDISGYAQLSPEVVVDRNPQVIILSFGDDISGNPAFQNVEAVKNGRMYTPPSDALHIAGPRFVDGIEELARWVYPGVFR